MTLVDSNVLLDLLTDDAEWAEWSIAALGAARTNGSLLINDIIYAEVSVGFLSSIEIEAFVGETGLRLVPTPRDALFLAGKAFVRYRRTGGIRTGVLPDFFIGAHAQACGLPLLTRDPKRIRTYFPSVRLLTPA